MARDGAVQEQIDDTVKDAVLRARVMMPVGAGADDCDDCGEDIPAARRAALRGKRTCVTCQVTRDASTRSVGINRRGSKDSQLRLPGNLKPRLATKARGALSSGEV